MAQVVFMCHEVESGHLLLGEAVGGVVAEGRSYQLSPEATETLCGLRFGGQHMCQFVTLRAAVLLCVLPCVLALLCIICSFYCRVPWFQGGEAWVVGSPASVAVGLLQAL
jgi:hypothetical protein